MTRVTGLTAPLAMSAVAGRHAARDEVGRIVAPEAAITTALVQGDRGSVSWPDDITTRENEAIQHGIPHENRHGRDEFVHGDSRRFQAVADLRGKECHREIREHAENKRNDKPHDIRGS
jgi:hypothetical protein